jgi:hypothetical protein
MTNTITPAELDAFECMNLALGTREIHGHVFTVSESKGRHARRQYHVDGLRVSIVEFMSMLDFALKMQRAAA